jgi:hypothetical protein
VIFETGEGLDMGNMGDPLHALKMDERVQDFEGINTPYAYFGGRHTLFGFHREDVGGPPFRSWVELTSSSISFL